MSKFKIKQVDDFKLPISFIMPNGEEAKFTFTVKHKRAKDVANLFNLEADKLPTDVEFIKMFATGWDLEEEFNDENLQDLVDFFPGCVASFSHTYTSALAGNRVKN